MQSLFSEFISQFHFLRPFWLISFIPMMLLLVWAWRRQSNNKSWLKVVDKRLQPFVLIKADEFSYAPSKWLAILALIICVVALAGPVWQKLPQAVYKPQSALVIVLDLSRSMDAADIKPSRLSRAKIKIIDLLNARKEGQVALIAYAAQAYTVSPLTDDNATVIALLKSLSTDIMPAQGSRMDRALTMANDLMAQANIQQGHILVVSDGVSSLELKAIQQVDNSKHIRSILAVGTEQGAPINLAQGGYLKSASGEIVVAKMNRQALLSIAQASQGVFATLRNDDADIKALVDLMRLNRFEQPNTKRDQTFDTWYEHGSWLLLLAVPFVLMAFRKGFIVVLMAFVLPSLQPAEALDWQSWFKNNDQKAAEKFKAGDFNAASEQFKTEEWRAAAQFKNEQYEEALNQYQQQKNAESLYNKGNALAQLKRYDEALKAWDETLKANPKHEDAAFNKKALEAFLKQQQDNKQQDKNQQQDQQDQNKQDKNQQNQQDQDQQDQQQKNEPSDQQQVEKKEQDKEPSNDKQAAQDEQKDEETPKQAKEKQQEQQKPQTKEELEQQQQAEEELKQQMSEPLDEETKQWLRRVPDDPGGLMRNKFRYQYKQLNRQNNEQNPW